MVDGIAREQAIYQALTAAAEVAAALPARLVEEHNADPERAPLRRAPSPPRSRYCGRLASVRPGTASRRGPGNIAESDEICVRNR
jgi:hypothetical protein